MNFQAASGRFWIGALLIALGALIFLDQLRLIDFGRFVSIWWPLLLVGAGLSKLLTRSGSPLFAFMLVASGAFLQLQRVGVIETDVLSLVLPLALIFFGASLLLGRSKPFASATTNRIDEVAILGGATHRVLSNHFQGGRIVAAMGKIELDLRDASLAESATLEATAALGSVTIRVPRHWRVEVSGMPILGAIENALRDPNVALDAPLLRISAVAALGQVEIRL